MLAGGTLLLLLAGQGSAPGGTVGSPDEYMTLTSWDDPDPAMTLTATWDATAGDDGPDPTMTLTTLE